MPAVIRNCDQFVPKNTNEFNQLCIEFAKFYKEYAMLTVDQVKKLTQEKEALTEFTLASEIVKYALEGQKVFIKPVSFYSEGSLDELVVRMYYLSICTSTGVGWLDSRKELLRPEFIATLRLDDFKTAAFALKDSAMKLIGLN